VRADRSGGRSRD